MLSFLAATKFLPEFVPFAALSIIFVYVIFVLIAHHVKLRNIPRWIGLLMIIGAVCVELAAIQDLYLLYPPENLTLRVCLQIILDALAIVLGTYLFRDGIHIC